MTESSRKELVNAYMGAGKPFLALKLARVFCPITNEQDRVLHNDMVNEVSNMLGAQVPLFLTAVAEQVFNLSVRDQTDGTTEKKDGTNEKK